MYAIRTAITNAASAIPTTIGTMSFDFALQSIDVYIKDKKNNGLDES